MNDHAPQTEEPSYRIYVPEDTPPGTPVLTLPATDRWGRGVIVGNLDLIVGDT